MLKKGLLPFSILVVLMTTYLKATSRVSEMLFQSVLLGVFPLVVSLTSSSMPVGKLPCM